MKTTWTSSIDETCVFACLRLGISQNAVDSVRIPEQSKASNNDCFYFSKTMVCFVSPRSQRKDLICSLISIDLRFMLKRKVFTESHKKSSRVKQPVPNVFVCHPLRIPVTQCSIKGLVFERRTCSWVQKLQLVKHCQDPGLVNKRASNKKKNPKTERNQVLQVTCLQHPI